MLLALLVLAAQPDDSPILPPPTVDRRRAVERERGLWPIGRIEGPGGVGTGFMVSPCFGVTANHVLTPTRTSLRQTPSNSSQTNYALFIGGPSRPGSPAQHWPNQRYFIERISDDRLNPSADWVVFRIMNCAREEMNVGWIGLTSVDLNASRENWTGISEEQQPDGLIVVGSPLTFGVDSDFPFTSQRCDARWASSGRSYLLSCQSSAGMSGSPVIRITSEGLIAVAVVFARASSHDGQVGAASYAEPLSRIPYPLRRQILEDRRAYGQPNPAAVPLRGPL